MDKVWEACRKCYRWIGKKFSWVPIIGPFFDCSLDSHKKSVKEFVPTLAFSTATFWMSAIFLYALVGNREREFMDVLLGTAESTELLIFSLAFLGTIIVSAAEDPDGARPFPGRAWHFLFVFSMAVVAAGFYALQRVEKAGGLRSAFDGEYIQLVSISIAALSILISYLTVLYRNQSFNPETEIKGREDDFSNAFRRAVE